MPSVSNVPAFKEEGSVRRKLICDITISYNGPEGVAMAQFIVRNLEDDVKARLKRRAARHGHSMEEEVRQILRSAVQEDDRLPPKLGSRIAACFAGIGLTEELPELRGQAVCPVDFEQ